MYSSFLPQRKNSTASEGGYTFLYRLPASVLGPLSDPRRCRNATGLWVREILNNPTVYDLGNLKHIDVELRHIERSPSVSC